MLSSATFPLNVCIILSDPFSNGSSFYVACVYNHCHCTSKSHHSMMPLKSHLSCFYDALFSYRFSFSFMINKTIMLLGPGYLVRAFFSFSENCVGRVSGLFSVGHVSGIFKVG